jgi:hypothetical protein
MQPVDNEPALNNLGGCNARRFARTSATSPSITRSPFDSARAIGRSSKPIHALR